MHICLPASRGGWGRGADVCGLLVPEFFPEPLQLPRWETPSICATPVLPWRCHKPQMGVLLPLLSLQGACVRLRSSEWTRHGWVPNSSWYIWYVCMNA